MANGERATYVSASALFDSNSSTPLTFVSAPGPVTADDMYNGENYDATLVQQGWSQCSFFPARNNTLWNPAALTSPDPTATASFNAYHQPVRPDRPYSPLNIREVSSGVFVADFGQNMAGIFTLRVTCSSPRTINLKLAETVDAEGKLFEAYGYWDQVSMRSISDFCF